MLYKGRDLKGINVARSGTVATVTTVQDHHWLTGDSITFAGNGVVSDGNHVMTKTGAQTFTVTVPDSGPLNSITGTVTHTNEVGRVNISVGGGIGSGIRSSPAFEWMTGLTVEETRTVPTGLSGVAPPPSGEGVYPVFADLWTRFWLILHQDRVGDSAEFNDWNTFIESDFTPGYKIGKWNATVATNGSGVATVTCTDGPHGYWRLGIPVTITGSGLADIDGTQTIATIPSSPTAESILNGGFTGPTTFTLSGTFGANLGPSPSCTIRLKFTAISLVLADETRDPILIYDHVPWPYTEELDVFIHEWNSSNPDTPAVQEGYIYNRNHVVLRGSAGLMSNVSLSNNTLFRKPVP